MRLLRTVLMFGLLALLASPAFAQDMPTKTTAETAAEPMLFLRKHDMTHPEQILLAYYHLAGAKPPVATWAALSPYLDKASDGDVPHIVQREENRLAQANATHVMDDVISIQTELDIRNYSTLNEVLTVGEFNPQTFFNYSLYGENIAVVPKDINNFHEIALTKVVMDDILSKTRGSPKIWSELLLKPIYADTNTPFMYNNKAYKLMLADVAEIRFWTNNGANPTLLWTYRADWYQPKTSADLMKLKSGNEAQ